MDRRAFISRIGSGISSSFVVGTLGGVALGTIGTSAILYSPAPTGGRVSYAQQGEDLLIEAIGVWLSIPLRSYLDIGAGDPIELSNTYLFYRKGCRGLLVEPNPELIGNLRAVRPRDTILNVGIGAGADDAADFYVIGDSSNHLTGLSTFSKEQAERNVEWQKGRFSIKKVVRLPLVNINQVMADHFRGAPDLLSVDTEGFDLPILQSIDFEHHRPAVICAETHAPSNDDGPKIIDLMHSRGYQLGGSTYINSIFVDGRFFR